MNIPFYKDLYLQQAGLFAVDILCYSSFQGPPEKLI